ncbi:MAG: hypothetical protein AB8B83_07800 [Bdellovibrionales bacterium]
MKKPAPKSTITAAIACAIIGLICGWVQNTYYGYMDVDGIIHDSIFLPLSMIFIALSFGIVIIAITQILINILSSKTKKET